MTREITTSNTLQDRAPVSEELGGEQVQSWMALQIAAHIRRTRTRRELFPRERARPRSHGVDPI